MEEKGEKAEVRVQRAYLEQGKAPTQPAFRLCVRCSVARLVRLIVSPGTAALQASLSMGFLRHEY